MANLKTTLIRAGLFAGVLLAFGLFVRFFRNIGPLEVGIVLGLIGLVVVIESVRYVVRQFLKGFRGD